MSNDDSNCELQLTNVFGMYNMINIYTLTGNICDIYFSIIDKIINTPNEDIEIAAFDEFCFILLSKPKLCYHALKTIGNKLQNDNPRQVMKCLKILEEAIKICGTEFQAEIGKFRFLNELIKLISSNYRGKSTPKEIVDKVSTYD